MSQFQNQNQLVEYRGRQAFEQPEKPTIYQEQMPILPTPSFKIGYTGINLAEIGYLAAKAGSSIFESVLEYDYKKKQQALQNLDIETEKQLETLYRQGASQDEIDKVKTNTQGKIKTILGMDIEDPNVKESDMGTKPASLLIGARKTMASVESSNARYSENLRASKYVEDAGLTSLSVADEFEKNPDAPIETYDTGIKAIENILSTIMPGKPVNTDSIKELKNPADREAAIKAYTALVKLRDDKNREIAARQKAEEEAKKGMAKAEEDRAKEELQQRKDENERLRDIFKRYDGNFKRIQDRLSFLQGMPAEERTTESQEEIYSLVKEFIDLKEQVEFEGLGWAYGRYEKVEADSFLRVPPDPAAPDWEIPLLPTQYRSIGSAEYSNRVIGDTIDSPEVRTAYESLLTQIANTQTSVGKTRLAIIGAEKKAQLELIESKWKNIEAEVEEKIAEAEKGGVLDAQKPVLLEQLKRFNTKTVGEILLFLGEDRLRELHSNFKLDYEKEAKEGFPSLSEQFSLGTAPEGQDLIRTAFAGNNTAWESWEKASIAYKGLQTKIFKEQQTGAGGVGEAAANEEQKTQEAFLVMIGKASVANIQPRYFQAAADRNALIALDPTGQLNLADPIAVKEAVRVASKDKEGRPIQLDILLASRATASIYAGATTAEDLITDFGSVLPKDANGNVIIPKPTAWTSSVNGTDFPIIEVIEEDLKKDSNSIAFKKALVMFALLPDKWRDQLVSAVGNKGTIRTLNEEIKNRRGANITTLTSIASRGGYTDELIQAATALGIRYAERSLYTRTKTETTAGDETPEETAERTRIVNGVVAELAKGQKDEEGNIRPFPNGFKPLPSLNGYRLAGLNTQMDFKWIVSRAAKYYSLYRTDMSVEQASSRAISEAVQEFKDERLVTPRGTVDMGTMPRDMLFSVDATGSFPQEKTGEGRLYPNQNPNSVILDQDPIDFVTTEASKFQGKQESYDSSYGFRIGSESNFTILDTTFGGRISGGKKISFVTPATKQVYFANSVLTTQNNNGGLSKQNRIALARLKFPNNATNEQNQGMIIGEIIEATMTPEQTTTRRDILVSAAVLKEIELAQQNPKSDFETWDQVLTFAKNKANEIRETLKQTGDKPTSDSPYTIMVTSAFITSSTGSYEVVPNLQLLRKLPDGSWQIMSNIREDFASAGYSGYTRKGNATDVEVASGIPQKDLETAPIPVLTQTMQDLYNKGLIKESFVIFPKDSEGRSNIYKRPDFMTGRFGIEQNMTLESQGDRNLAIAVVVTIDNGVVKVDRGLKEVSYSGWPGVFDDNIPASMDKGKITEVIPFDSKPKPKKTKQKPIELSPITQTWIQESKKYARGRSYENVPLSTAVFNPDDLKKQLTVVEPNTSIEEAIQYPEEPLGTYNKVSVSVERNPKDNIYYVVPNRWQVENPPIEKHLGGFYNLEDARRYARELELFMARQEYKKKPQPTPDSLSSVMNFYMPFMG